MQLEVFNVVMQVLVPVSSGILWLHLGNVAHKLVDQILKDADSILWLLQISLELFDLLDLFEKASVLFLETHDLYTQMSQVMWLSRLGLRLANIHFFLIAAHLLLRFS